MSTEGDISINLRLEDKDFTVTVQNSGRLLRQLRQDLLRTADATGKVERHFNSFSGHFKSFMMTVAATRFALMDVHQVFLALPISVAKTAGEFERLTKLMQGLSRASTEAAKASEAMKSMSYIVDMAKQAPFEVRALADAFVKLKSGGLDPLNGSMNALVNSVAKFGGDSQTLHRASIAIQQMAGKGVISMEELRQQLGEAVPNAMELMARGMGMSMAELTEKVSKGTVEAKSALSKMFIEMEIDAHGAAKAMMETLPGAVAELKTSWQLFQKEIAEGGFSNEVKSQLRELSSYLNSKDGTAFAKELGESLVSITKTLIELKDILKDNLDLIKTIGSLLLTAFAGTKLRSAYESMKQMIEEQKTIASAAAKERDKAFAEQLDQHRVNANRIRTEIAEKKALIAADRDAFKAKIASDIERTRSEIDANKKIIADRLSHYQELQRQALAAERESQASAARAGQMRKGVDAGGYVMRDLTGASRNEYAAKQYAQTAAEVRSLASAHLEAAQAAQRDNVAKEASIAASSRLKFALTDQHREILAGISSQTQYVRGLEGVIAATEKARKTVSVAGTAVVGFGKSLLSMVGWGIAVQGAFWAIGELWDMLAGKTERAARAQERYQRIRRGQATDDDVKGQSAELAAAEQRLANREYAIKQAEKAKNPNQSYISQLKGELPKLRGDVDRLREGINRARADIQTAEVEKDAAAITSRVQSEAEKLIYGSSSYKVLEKATQDLAKAQDSGNEKSIGAARKNRDAAKQTWLNEYAASYERVARETIARMRRSGEFTKAAIDKADRELFGPDGAVSAKREQALSALSPNKFVSGKDKGAGTAKQTEFQKALADIKERAAQLNAELDKKGTGTLAKLLEGYKLDPKISKAEFAELEKLVGMLQGKTDQISADNLLDKAQEQFAGLQESANGGSSAIAKMRQQIFDLLALTNDLDAIDKLQQALDLTYKSQGIEDAEKLAKSVDVANDFRAKAYDISTGMLSDRSEILERQYALEVENALREIELRRETGKISAEAYAVEMEGFMVWLKARNEQLVRDSETPMQKLARDWKNTTDAMERASTSWADKTIDVFMEMSETGKFEWRGLVDSILKDTLRIQMQKNLGEPLQQLFDGGIKWAEKNVMGDGSKQSGQQQTSLWESVTGAVKSFWKTITGADDAAGSLAEQAGEAAVSTAKAVIQDGMQASSTMSVTSSMNMLANAALAAANALSAIGGSGGLGGSITSGFGSGILDGIGSIFGGSSWDTGIDFSTSADVFDMMDFADIDAFSTMFANGGIMTQFGPAALRKYAMGGIANSPQLALFGEGSMPEAYVPLPDGRSIPVSFSGSGMMGGATIVNVNVHEAAGTKSEVKQSRNEDGSMNIDIIIQQIEDGVAKNVTKGRGSLAGAMERTYGLNRAKGSFR